MKDIEKGYSCEEPDNGGMKNHYIIIGLIAYSITTNALLYYILKR